MRNRILPWPSIPVPFINLLEISCCCLGVFSDFLLNRKNVHILDGEICFQHSFGMHYEQVDFRVPKGARLYVLACREV
jgi:hypothetical protein